MVKIRGGFDPERMLDSGRPDGVQAGPGGNANLRTVTVRVVPAVTVGTPYEVTQVIRRW